MKVLLITNSIQNHCWNNDGQTTFFTVDFIGALQAQRSSVKGQLGQQWKPVVGAPRDAIPLCNEINTANGIGNARAVDIRPRCKSFSFPAVVLIESGRGQWRKSASPKATWGARARSKPHPIAKLYAQSDIPSTDLSSCCCCSAVRGAGTTDL